MLAIAGAAVSLAFAGLQATTAQAADKSAPQAATGIVNSSAGARSTSTYWTKARMAAATPEPVPQMSAKAAAAPTVPDRLPATAAAPARPLTPAKGATATGGVRPLVGSGAALWTPHGSMPATTVGKIYFTRTDGSGGYCTGSVITASNLNTVWTAGHCVNAGSGGGWFSNFSFVPDTDNGSAPWGSWSWKYANTTVGWQNSGDLHYDVAAIAFYPANGNLQSTLGAQGYRFNYGQAFAVTDFGYPQDGYLRTDFPANGSKLYYCSGTTYRKSSSNDLMGLSCDMHHGASGGPWLTELASWGGGYIVGAYSHRDVNSSGAPSNIEARSANHGDGAINVYNDVSVH
ncbi:hypothetical protein QWU11_13995 [Actinomadura sp. DC4]|nr:hypothetical protein [Actinomadura sp. DC4]